MDLMWRLKCLLVARPAWPGTEAHVLFLSTDPLHMHIIKFSSFSPGATGAHNMFVVKSETVSTAVTQQVQRVVR